jgi:hypothetical protein
MTNQNLDTIRRQGQRDSLTVGLKRLRRCEQLTAVMSKVLATQSPSSRSCGCAARWPALPHQAHPVVVTGRASGALVDGADVGLNDCAALGLDRQGGSIILKPMLRLSVTTNKAQKPV